MKYLRLTEQVKLIKNDNITIETPIAIAIPNNIELINVLFFNHNPLNQYI
jgi:hypothetical protein